VDVEIPSEIDGVKVKSVGCDAFAFCQDLKSVKLDDGITDIGPRAFDGCKNLTNIDIPDSVNNIESKAFYNCNSLTSIKIPDGVVALSKGTFYCCTSLTSIIIPKSMKSIEFSTFFKCDNATYYVPNNAVRQLLINSGLSEHDTKIQVDGRTLNELDFKFDATNQKIVGYNILRDDMNIPSEINGIKVKSIGDNAFAECSTMKSTEIPDGVTSIGIKAFCNCYDLEGITIPESVTSIGGGAFLMCDNLKSITLPSNLTSIEPSTFVGCDKLTSINLPKNLKSIGNGAFAECNSLDNITIPEGTKSIDKFAFDNCTLLKSVVIPNSVTYIGENAFDGCNDAIFYVNSGEQKQRLIDSGVNGSKIVVANQPQKVQVTNISLSLNNLDCVIGDKKTLTEIVTPSGATDQTVTWTSSNNNVVTVDQNGNINAVGAGSATITCTANDGSGINATCAVTVNGQSSTGSGNTGGTSNTGGNSGITNLTNVKVAGITIGGNSSIGTKGGTLILTLNITPSNATNKNVTWTSSNPSVATVNAQGVVTAVANGTSDIIATAADGSGITVNKLITVTGQTASSTGSDSILESVSISGTEEVSHRLKANVRYTGTEPSLDYKWQRADTRDGDYTDISGADEKEYRLKSSDRNKYIKVIVTATINGTNYTVNDTAGKIDRNTSNDDDNSDSSNNSANNDNNNNVVVLRPTTTTNYSPSGKIYNSTTSSSFSPSVIRAFTNPSGHPVGGWVKVNNNWYYMNSNGMPKVGWLNDNGKWYYLDQTGIMIRNSYIDGYWLGGDGAMV
jgi:uncharacterized protein YjdB